MALMNGSIPIVIFSVSGYPLAIVISRETRPIDTDLTDVGGLHIFRVVDDVGHIHTMTKRDRSRPVY